MIEMQHRAEPAALARYRRNHPQGDWQADDFHPVKEEVRRALHQEQDGLCVYCEQQIGQDDGHVEHIRPRSRFPAQTFDYDNLAHSCNGPGHCGHHKQGRVLPIEPRPGCNRYFQLMARDGFLVPAPDLPEEEHRQAAETIDSILGLNTPRLTRQRKQFADILRHLETSAQRAEFARTAPFRWSLQGLY